MLARRTVHHHVLHGSLALACASACGPGDPAATDAADTTAATTTDTSPTDAPATSDPAPTPTFGYGARSCGGLGFTAARVAIGDTVLPEPPPSQDPDAPFSDRLTGWQPASQGLTVEFALDGRSFSPRFVVIGPAATMQGVRGTLTVDINGEAQPVGDVMADAAGNLEFTLTEFGHGLGLPYTLVLTGWPAGSCDELRIELPC